MRVEVKLVAMPGTWHCDVCIRGGKRRVVAGGLWLCRRCARRIGKAAEKASQR